VDELRGSPCVPDGRVKHPAFPNGARLSLGAHPTLTPTNAAPISLTKEGAASQKFEGYTRYVGQERGRPIAVLVRSLGKGRTAMHISMRFSADDW